MTTKNTLPTVSIAPELLTAALAVEEALNAIEELSGLEQKGELATYTSVPLDEEMMEILDNMHKVQDALRGVMALCTIVKRA